MLKIPMGEAEKDLNSVILPYSDLGNDNGDAVSIMYISYNGLEELIDTSTNDSDDSGPIVNSNILSISVKSGDEKVTKLKTPALLQFKNINDSFNVDETRQMCSFWYFTDSNENGYWNQSGCSYVSEKSDSSVTVCSCDHLTNFAVLFDIHGVIDVKSNHGIALTVITYFGISISLVCLFVAWITFQFILKFSKENEFYSERNSIHKNLVFCLFTAELIFILGIDQVSRPVLCSVIAGLLHYFFLAAFFWMLMEGVILYFMFVQVFECSIPRLPLYYLVSYLCPLIIVGVIAVVKQETVYGTDYACWINREEGFIWAFLAPVSAIIVFNIIMLLVVLCAMRRLMTKWTAQQKRSQVSTALALTIVLGLTWVLGYFYVDSTSSIYFAYAFTIANALQGFFIYLFYCIVDTEARRGYKRFVRKNDWLPDSLRSLVLGKESSSYLASHSHSSSQAMQNLVGKPKERMNSNSTQSSNLPVSDFSWHQREFQPPSYNQFESPSHIEDEDNSIIQFYPAYTKTNKIPPAYHIHSDGMKCNCEALNPSSNDNYTSPPLENDLVDNITHL